MLLLLSPKVRWTLGSFKALTSAAALAHGVSTYKISCVSHRNPGGRKEGMRRIHTPYKPLDAMYNIHLLCRWRFAKPLSDSLTNRGERRRAKAQQRNTIIKAFCAHRMVFNHCVAKVEKRLPVQYVCIRSALNEDSSKTCGVTSVVPAEHFESRAKKQCSRGFIHARNAGLPVLCSWYLEKQT